MRWIVIVQMFVLAAILMWITDSRTVLILIAVVTGICGLLYALGTGDIEKLNPCQYLRNRADDKRFRERLARMDRQVEYRRMVRKMQVQEHKYLEKRTPAEWNHDEQCQHCNNRRKRMARELEAL